MLLSSNSYITVIAFSLIVILSYIFNIISKKTRIPSVLMLIVLGIGIKILMQKFNLPEVDYFSTLEVVGIVGLIMIVLEAALDLKLTKDKIGLIVKSLLCALLMLVTTAFVCAYILNHFLIEDFKQALVYAVPISVLSSAIVIPSIGDLMENKKEFLIYEATFSDILGILFFYFLIGTDEGATAGSVASNVVINILLTIGIAVLVSYVLIYVFQAIKTEVKLFLLIAILLLLYAIGKLSGLSSLIIILIFGMILNNHKIFVRGFMDKLVKRDRIEEMLEDFHVVTLETAFVVRTFFFVIFGITITLSTLLNWEVALLGILLVVSFYLVRFLFLRIFIGSKLLPELFVAPRGLITILLFFAIPEEYLSDNFNPAILMYAVIITSLVMTYGLIKYGDNGLEKLEEGEETDESIDEESSTDTELIESKND